MSCRRSRAASGRHTGCRYQPRSIASMYLPYSSAASRHRRLMCGARRNEDVSNSGERSSSLALSSYCNSVRPLHLELGREANDGRL